MRGIPQFGEGFAEGHCTKSFWHGRLLLDLGDSAHAVIDLDFMQLIRGNSGRIAVVAVTPHAVGSSSERMDPTLDEGLNKLNA
jgi:hypothetical protein